MNPEILNVIASEFRASGQFKLRDKCYAFRQGFNNNTLTMKEAIAFQSEMRSILSSTDPEARYWLECIADMVETVRERVSDELKTESLSRRPGEIRVKRWDKRHWNDAPAPVKRVIQSYIKAGWNLEKFDTWQNKGFDCNLTQCQIIGSKSWQHYKSILINKAGKIEAISKEPSRFFENVG